jgi:Uma2 family endonuclease
MPSSRHGVIDSVFEVCGPGESWVEIYAKVGQYLRAGVLVVCISDEKSQTLTIFSQNDPPQTLPADAEFSLPAILGDFRVTVRRFFE